jgi:hypothetical protein
VQRLQDQDASFRSLSGPPIPARQGGAQKKDFHIPTRSSETIALTL